MKKYNFAGFCRTLGSLFLLFVITAHCKAQEADKNALPVLNIVPGGIAKPSFLFYSDKSENLKREREKLLEEKKAYIQKCKGLIVDSPEDKQCQAEASVINLKLNDLIPRINSFNTQIEEIVFKDPALDIISIITYCSLKKDQKAWDEFQKNVSLSKLRLAQDKIKIQQELTKIKSKKQTAKAPYNEGVILSMFTDQAVQEELEDSLYSPYTGESYKEMNSKMESGNTPGSGAVIVSFGTPRPETDPIAVASKGGAAVSKSFTLESSRSKSELNKLKEKSFDHLIAHSNGATVAECLLKDSLIEVKELNIIGGDKALLNRQALQQLLDNGNVKSICIWINLDDPSIWLTPVNQAKIVEQTENFITFKDKLLKDKVIIGSSKIEYKWILGNGSLNALNAKDPGYIAAYFKEISKDFKTK